MMNTQQREVNSTIMKNYSLKPTEENALQLMKSDPIGRNQAVFRFVQMLDNIDDCCTIAVNGEWGAGKTFFIRQVKLILDAQNPQSKMDKELRNDVNRLIPDDFKYQNSYATVYYDAWLNDVHEDPILSLIYAIVSSNQSEFTLEKKRSILNGAAAIASALSGRDFSKVWKEAKGEDLFAEMKNADDIRCMVRGFINSLIYEHGNRLVIFIDELDRCKPDYAIRFLERIKHYFDNEQVVFVFSVSLSQLQWTVKSYYGSGFNATRYLDKFFDLRTTLPKVDYDKYINRRFGFEGSYYIFDTVCVETIKYFDFSLRESERYIRLVKIAARQSAHRFSGGFPEHRAVQFSVLYVVPIIIGLQMADMQDYMDFVEGRDAKHMLEILQSPNIRLRTDYLMLPNESYNEVERTFEKTGSSVKLEDRLLAVYDALFSKLYDNRYHENDVGAMSFSMDARKNIDEIVALISRFADYKFE